MEKRDEFFFEFLKKCHEEQFRNMFDKTQLFVEANKIRMSSNSQEFDIIHENIHRTLMTTSIGILYMSLNKIYEILVDCFCTKLGEEIDLYWANISKKGKIQKALYTMQHMEDLWIHLGEKENFLNFAQFCTDFYKRYQKLLDHTHIVQEGVAAYISANYQFEEYDDETFLNELAIWQEQQKKSINRKKKSARNTTGVIR